MPDLQEQYDPPPQRGVATCGCLAGGIRAGVVGWGMLNLKRRLKWNIQYG